MNRQEFEDTARRYREEMFRMYASQSLDPPPKPPQTAQKQPARDTPPVSGIAPLKPHDHTPIADPPPAEPPAPAEPEADFGDTELAENSDSGTILVHVATAQGTRPVVGATVTVTRMFGGDTHLISLQITDLSGNISPVTVPAPPPSADQRNPAAFHYDISVQAAGYYREHSTDVPVFPNITSMQSFDLIPLPAGTDDPFPGGDITFYNQMPEP